MHRGRSRSRKPVESQSTSQSLSTTMSHNSTGNNIGTEKLSTTGSRSFQNMPSYSVGSSEVLSFGSNINKLQMEPASFTIENNTEFRYMQGLTAEAEGRKFSLETSAGSRGGGMSSNSDSTWNLLPFQISSSPSQKANDTLFQGNSSQMLMSQALIHQLIQQYPNKLHQHCFFGSDIGAAGAEKQGNLPSPFLMSTTSREVWSNLVDEASNKNFQRLNYQFPLQFLHLNLRLGVYNVLWHLHMREYLFCWNC
ncbi:hypothetical protein Leryth_005431 [Lithospermum erythrorhizon]|nr:hypothetical protein Leryth_005431 [Lithospermum erythrorhizon]